MSTLKTTGCIDRKMAKKYEEWIEGVDRYLKANLSEKRYLHSLRTADIAEKMCMKHHCDETKGRLAGLAHDIAREHSHEDVLELASMDLYPVSDFERRTPKVVHGKAGAVILRRDFGIDDEDILEAVRWHTTGCANMGALAQIIYVADYIEPGRRHVDNEFRQRVIDAPLQQAVLEILQRSIDHCRSKGRTIAESSFMLYHDLNRKVNGS